MQEKPEIKRLQGIARGAKETAETKEAPKSAKSLVLPKPVKFKIPEFVMNLEFFLNKGNEPLTAETLVEAVFKGEGKNLTPAEQLYAILKAMEDLEIIAPLEFECPHCKAHFNSAVNLAKTMKGVGESHQEFHIQEGKYVFKFKRPDQLGDVSHITSPVASSGMFMLQWLEAHNQGEDFDILKMPIADLLKVIAKFGDFLFGVTFNVSVKCDECGKKANQEFEVGLEDLVQIINEI